MTSTTSPTHSIARSFVAEYPDVNVDPILAAAREAYMDLLDHNRAAVAFEPGNGFAYRVVVTEVEHPGFPGNLLVALPDWNACMLLTETGGTLHVPGYVAEKMPRLGDASAAVVACFATILGEFYATPPS